MAGISYFYIDESPYHIGKFIIKPTTYLYNTIRSVKGSYHVYGARLFGISYADYLRMLRDRYGATIVGKNQTYPVAYFENKEKANEVITELNKRFRKIALRY